MKDTGIQLTDDWQQRMAIGHSGVVPAANWDLPTLAGAGALRSTAADMVKFIQANIQAESDNHEHLPDALATAMRTSHEPHEAMPGSANIGLCWMIQPGTKGTFLWHNGGTGGFRSFAGFRLDGTLGVVLLTNSSNALDGIGVYLLNGGGLLPPIPDRPKLEPQELQALEGDYELAPGVILNIKQTSGHLTAQLTGQPRLSIYPKTNHQFEYLEVPATLQFEPPENGKSKAVTLFQNGVKQAAQRITP